MEYNAQPEKWPPMESDIQAIHRPKLEEVPMAGPVVELEAVPEVVPEAVAVVLIRMQQL